MAERRKPTHQKKKRRAKRKESSFLRTALTLCFCVLAFVFSAFSGEKHCGFLHKSREVFLHHPCKNTTVTMIKHSVEDHLPDLKLTRLPAEVHLYCV